MLGRRRLRGALRQRVIGREDHNSVLDSSFHSDYFNGKLYMAFNHHE